MQTPIDDSGIFYRGIEKHTSFLLVLVRSPHKGQAPSRITPWIALGLPHAQVGLRCAFRQASPRISLCHLHYQASGQNAVGLAL
jgi:hypothetical protein